MMNDGRLMSIEFWEGVDLKGKVGLWSQQTCEIFLSLLKCESGGSELVRSLFLVLTLPAMKERHVLLNPNVLDANTTKIAVV